ncbi:hypothetical protein [Legionella tunisiensis]|uniref:hypothetical protein n=1 Tax=Legionella tunisiensis TaxID=1034944 RepID=UPI0003111E03|nr:hypothetical protein [Legionella tunisiensis]
MRLHYDLALDSGASEEVLDLLATGEQIPCFWQANTLAPQCNDWATCLVPAQRFVSNEVYFMPMYKVQHCLMYDKRKFYLIIVI